MVNKKRKAFWLKQLHQWHWITSALCLISLLLFSITGITLNHASAISADPAIREQVASLPAPLLEELGFHQAGALPVAVRNWLDREMQIRVGDKAAEWSAGEVYLALPRPGGDAWLAIDLDDGAVLAEQTDRGWIAFFNDLHKGRHTGIAWSWFIDIFAVASLLFALTGLGLMMLHAKRRPATWPVTLAGLVLPWLLIVVFMH
ncbi:PepSY-associated TM helix domain-containing protein [uncultured Alcanivorax sp.]|uniref:PepSY-associated TM helix domain-containing protein n=1 Tax=Alcanivorax sp. IL2 TaxID=3396310 RepID=UPI002621D19E|nr:PepSY-associated TM helix domain-containing protein [uncultured Alcanivorax sp.]